ncbi:MAG: hypothetical protein GY801_21320 [bacterium]|nr:hypothetical protein [bacterium]
MAEKQEQPQETHKNSLQEPSQAISKPNTSETETPPPASRPRTLPEAERVVKHEKKRSLQRDARAVAQTGGSELPKPSATSIIEQQERWIPAMQKAAPVESEKIAPRIIEDREMVKWAAWGALFVSLVTSCLLGLYSSREFGPMFEYDDLEVTQQQIVKDVRQLKHSSRLEKIQNAITHAQVQLFVRKNYGVAEGILENVKEDLKRLIATLPIEKTVEPKQVLANIERVLGEVRQGPASLDKQLDTISQDLSKLKD